MKQLALYFSGNYFRSSKVSVLKGKASTCKLLVETSASWLIAVVRARHERE